MTKYDPLIKKCRLCNSVNIFKFHQAENGSQIYKCSHCKVQFMNPQYSDEYLTDLYSSYIRDETQLEEKLVKSHSYCLQLIQECAFVKGKLLDIGSGNGYLIKIAKQRGWDPTGHEINCDSAETLHVKTGIRILCGEIYNLNIEERFDAISMLHVIEHLKNPEKYIEKIFSVLNKKGVLFLALPNIQSPSSLFKLILEKTKLKTKNVAAYYDTGHHLWYFSPHTIRSFLEENGFKIIRIYSGENINLNRNKFFNVIDEKILSKVLWHSSMGVIARKL